MKTVKIAYRDGSIDYFNSVSEVNLNNDISMELIKESKESYAIVFLANVKYFSVDYSIAKQG